MNLNFKSHFGELKDLDLKGRRVSMYLSSFDNVDHDNDIIVKGAFKRSLDNRKDQIFFLNQHRWHEPHGKFDELVEDDYGLFGVSNKMTDTTYSMDALKLYDAGIVKEHSIGFNTIVDEYSKETGIRTIKEVKLWEGSNVTLGANPLTPFRGFKSLSKDEIDEEYKLLLNAFRKGTFTDETFGQLEIALQMLKTKSAELAVQEYKASLQPAEPHLDSMEEETKAIYEFLQIAK